MSFAFCSPLNREDRIKEQKKYGIFFEDDYDYLQHLKERQAKVELVAVSQPKKDAVRTLCMYVEYQHYVYCALL